jgi:transcriptional regulator
MAEPLDVVRGTLDLMILKTLSWSPMHGLAIVRWIERTTEAQLQIEEGALYPALHRMEQKKWLQAEWRYTEQGRKAKFYRITAAGRRQLTAELSRWERYSNAIGLVIAAQAPAAAAAR